MIFRVLKNFVILFGGSILAQAFMFFGLAHVARILGPTYFGLFNFAQSYTMFSFRLNELGIEVDGIKKINAGNETVAEIINNVVITRLCIALILIMITMILCILNIFPNQTVLLIVISSFSVLSVALSVEWVFEALMNVSVVVTSRVIKGVLFAVPVFLFVVESGDSSTAMMIYVISITIPAVVILFYTVSKYQVRLSINLGRSWSVIRESFSIGFTYLVTNYNLYIGTFLLTYLMTADELGYYSAAQRVIVLLGVFIVANSHRTLLPLFFRAYGESKDKFTSVVSIFFRLFSVLSFLFSLLIIVSAKEFVPIVFGKPFIQSITLFKLLSVSMIFYIIRSVIEVGYIASYNVSRYLYSNLVAAFAYTILIPIMALKYGLQGVGFGAIIAEASTLVLQLMYFRLLPFSFASRTIVKPLIAFFIALFVHYFINDFPAFIRIITPVVLYAILLFVLNAVNKDELKMFMSKIYFGNKE